VLETFDSDDDKGV